MMTTTPIAEPVPTVARKPVVLLTGSGFVGSALRRRLEGRGRFRVAAFTSRELDLLQEENVDRLADALRNGARLIYTALMPRRDDAFQTLADECAAIRLVALAVLRARPAHVTFFSSTAVYGDANTNLAITEATVPAPLTPYAYGKVLGEALLREVAEQAGIPLLILRPCMLYGPGDHSRAYGPGNFLRSIRREGAVHLFGDGAELRDYLFIEDLVDVTIRLALDKSATGVYNLTGGACSFRDLAACLRDACREPFGVVHRERRTPPSDQVVLPAKLSKVMPDFCPTPLAVGLREAWQALTVEAKD